jgi:hypothetical protein
MAAAIDHTIIAHRHKVEVTAMKPVVSVVLTFTLASVTSAVPAQSQSAPPASATPARNILSNNDCMRVDKINEWHVVDNKTVIARTGPYQRYLINLQAECQWLGIANNPLRFRPNASERATSNRICGQVNETVSSRNQPPCGIQSVSLISEAQFDDYRAHSKYHSVTAQQPSKTQTP